MRLTQVLRVFFPINNRTPGRKYMGKNPKVKPIKTSAKVSAVNFMMMEEQNLSYINNFYLSEEEEEVYGKDHPERRVAKRQAYIEKMKRPFFADMTLEEHFKSIDLSRKWE